MVKNNTVRSLCFLFVLSGLMMLRQLATPGYFSIKVTDTYAYTSWAWQFAEALKEGVAYPRWMPVSFWGYGSPPFILYPPLAFYFSAVANFFTSSVITAMNITKSISLFFSAMGMYFLVREFYSEKIALLTAAFFLVFPLIIANYYLFDGFASVISYMWFSPILLFTYRYFNKGHYKHLLYAGAFYGALVLTHLINAYMFTWVLLAFFVLHIFIRKELRYLTAIPILFGVGLLLSSAYSLPFLLERNYFNLGFLTKEYAGFNYGSCFFLPKLTAKLPAAHFWPVYYYEMVFHLLLFITLFLLFLYQTRLFRNEEIKHDVLAVNYCMLGVVSVSIFFTFGASTYVWETIPFMKYIQFPIRWFNIAAYALIFLSATAFSAPGTISKKKKGYLIKIILFLACFLISLNYIKKASYLPDHELMPVKNVYLTREHLPAWVDVHKIDQTGGEQDKTTIMKGEGKTEISAWKSAERVIIVNAETPLTLRIRTFYFPGWKGYLDGTEIAVQIESGTGAMVLDIPKGDHILELKFTDTPVRFYGKLISLISLIALGGFLVIDKFRKTAKVKT